MLRLPSVSIVLTAFNRYKQLQKTLESIIIQEYRPEVEVIVVEHGNDGQTKWIAERAGAKYIQVPREPFPAFQNPARIHNIGIRAAQNEVVILQGAEVRYTGKDDIVKLVSPIVDDSTLVTTPVVACMNEKNEFYEWYMHPTEGRRTGWIVNFCLAMRRDLLLKINGFDEGFISYGYEDDAFIYCLRKNGAHFEYIKEVLAQHQWHDRSSYPFNDGFTGENSPQYAYGVELRRKIDAGEQPAVSNYGKTWGQL